jgi:hypothetical protein
MTDPVDEGLSAVEVRPEVVFLSELLEELTTGRLRIPRFQRPFVWRRDQMTDLLDSVHKQYPIGSLLVWEADVEIATLDRLGPFEFPERLDRRFGYVLDGHQRLSTLAGALMARDGYVISEKEEDPGRWSLCWNMESQRFQHGNASSDPGVLFPLTALLDTLRFFAAIEVVRRAVAPVDPGRADRYTSRVSEVARAFQHYRVPVIRMRKTNLSAAVEIFARLNSKGQEMAADQMVSALMYRQDERESFDLAVEIDRLVEQLGEDGFGDIDRTAVLRAVLANLDEDIYRTDWTRLAEPRREEILPRLRNSVGRTAGSLVRAVEFLRGEGVAISRLLPYSMQLVVLSAFFDAQPKPSAEHLSLLRRWFWVSSFSGWFGGANPSRVNSLVAEFRQIATRPVSGRLANFDLAAESLPFPATFDMRSARTRVLLLVMLSLRPRSVDGNVIESPWRGIAEKGPGAVGHIFAATARGLSGNPANRMIRPPGSDRGQLYPWLASVGHVGHSILRSHGVDEAAYRALQAADVPNFISARQAYLIRCEHEFQREVGVTVSLAAVGAAPIDTD